MSALCVCRMAETRPATLSSLCVCVCVYVRVSDHFRCDAVLTAQAPSKKILYELSGGPSMKTFSRVSCCSLRGP